MLHSNIYLRLDLPENPSYKAHVLSNRVEYARVKCPSHHCDQSICFIFTLYNATFRAAEL